MMQYPGVCRLMSWDLRSALEGLRVARYSSTCTFDIHVVVTSGNASFISKGLFLLLMSYV